MRSTPLQYRGSEAQHSPAVTQRSSALWQKMQADLDDCARKTEHAETPFRSKEEQPFDDSLVGCCTCVQVDMVVSDSKISPMVSHLCHFSFRCLRTSLRSAARYPKIKELESQQPKDRVLGQFLFCGAEVQEHTVHSVPSRRCKKFFSSCENYICSVACSMSPRDLNTSAGVGHHQRRR